MYIYICVCVRLCLWVYTYTIIIYATCLNKRMMMMSCRSIQGRMKPSARTAAAAGAFFQIGSILGKLPGLFTYAIWCIPIVLYTAYHFPTEVHIFCHRVTCPLHPITQRCACLRSIFAWGAWFSQGLHNPSPESEQTVVVEYQHW